MHGVYALQHVISLVDWPKHVKSFLWRVSGYTVSSHVIPHTVTFRGFGAIIRKFLRFVGAHEDALTVRMSVKKGVCIANAAGLAYRGITARGNGTRTRVCRPAMTIKNDLILLNTSARPSAALLPQTERIHGV